MIAEFFRIYENGQKDQLIPFLQKLNEKEKNRLLLEIKRKNKKKERGMMAGKTVWHDEVVRICTFVLFPASSVKRLLTFDLPDEQVMDELLEWYCPEWFSDYYNMMEYSILSYSYLVKWTQKGYLQPSNILIARSLSASAPDKFEKEGQEEEFHRLLEQNAITFDEHIWYLFQYPSIVAFRDTWSLPYGSKEEGLWVKAFKKYTANGRISRLEVLRQCMKSVHNGLEKETVNWFASLFAALKPQPEEILAIQEDMMSVFTGKLSKPVNVVLNELKKVAIDKDFHADTFISYQTVLLSSEVKSILLSTLTLLEKIACFHPDDRVRICKGAMLVFLNKDLTLQSRAATLIAQYGKHYTEAIGEALLPYADILLSQVREYLSFYLIGKINQPEPEDVNIPVNPGLINEDNRIPEIHAFDELLFFLAGLFESKEPYVIDLLPATLIKLNKEVTAANVGQLEVVFQKVYDAVMQQPFWHSYDYQTKAFEKTNFHWNIGLYKHLMAAFLVAYGQYLVRKFPYEAAFIQSLHKETEEKDRQNKDRISSLFEYDYLIRPLADWKGAEYPIFRPYHRIMMRALSFIEQGTELELLSTPTHTPCWIAPGVLKERLDRYVLMKQKPESADLQLAFSRCPDTVKGGIDYPDKDMNISQLSEHLNTYSWNIADEKRSDASYTEYAVLEVHIPPSPWQQTDNIYACISDDLRLCVGTWDFRYFIQSYPLCTDIPCALLVKYYFEFSRIPNAENRDMLLQSVIALYDLKVETGEMTSLFLACCMLCSEKTIRTYAAEIYLERAATDMLDVARLGKIIGYLENREWAPVKRFLDLIVDTLLNQGQRANRQLELLLVSILSQIERPILNLKKLLEIYDELIYRNNSKADLEQIPQLLVWEQDANLKKVVKLLLNESR